MTDLLSTSAAPGISPVQAFDLHMRLARDFGSPHSWLRQAIHSWYRETHDTRISRADTDAYCADFSTHLLRARTFWISETMTRQVIQATDDVLPQPFYVTDLPALSGIIFFERPLLVVDGLGQIVSIAALDFQDRANHLVYTRFTSSSAPEDQFLHDLHHRYGMDAEAWRQRTPLPYFGRDVLKYGYHFGTVDDIVASISVPEDREDVDPDEWKRGQARMNAVLLSVLSTLFTLMNQPSPVAAQESFVGSRKERKYLQREADRHGVDPDLVTVSLRRPAHAGESTGTGEKLAYRQVVDGHWKWQWYPSYAGPCTHCTKGEDGGPCLAEPGEHRRIYVLDYERGPEDAPLRDKPNKVYKLVR